MRPFFQITFALSFTTILGFAACQKKGKAELGMALIDAVREGSARDARKLIEEGASLNVRDENGEILWRVALEHYNKRVWDVLVENKIDLSQVDSSGSYAIHVAAANGLSDAVEKILVIDAGKMQLNANGDTPLIAASRYGMEHVLIIMAKFFQQANERNKFGDTPLIESSRSGNIKAVELILKYKPTVPAANYNGQTAVSIARYYNFTDIARLLESFGAENPVASKELLIAAKTKNLPMAIGAVNRGANVNVEDENGYSPLSYAVELGNKPMVDFLRSKGAWNALASRRLVLAIRNDNSEIFKNSLNEYADINYTDKVLQTPLLVAASFGNYDMVKTLLERGAFVNARDRDGYSAVFYAAQENRVRIIDELIKYKADLKRKNNFGYTPLILASARGHVEMVRRLINAGVDVNATADNGGTAAYWAAIKDYDEVVRILVAAGAIDPKNNKELVLAARTNDVARAERALEANINIDLKNEDGYTALMYAVNSGAIDVAKFLLDRKSRINLQDRDGYTPLMIAAFRGNQPMMEMLMVYRPDVNLKHRSGRTALIMATWKGTPAMMAHLLKVGARVNDQDLDGWTALMFAAHEGNMEKVQLLINARALVKIKNKKGQMAQDLAAARQAEDVANFLAQRRA
ncbi:MAG: hypothetical protein LDLANPLL_02921 [Turneriella sp.]|nr:hypothetical protein [Turneriella sp.]